MKEPLVEIFMITAASKPPQETNKCKKQQISDNAA